MYATMKMAREIPCSRLIIPPLPMAILKAQFNSRKKNYVVVPLLHKNSKQKKAWHPPSHFGILGAYLFIASDSKLSKESFHLLKKSYFLATTTEPF